MSTDQIKSMVRWLLTAAGAWAVGKGWITAEQAAALASDQTFQNIVAAAGALVAIGSGIYGMIARQQKSMVAAVAAMPEVVAIQTARTDDGGTLAQSVPSPIVTMAPASGVSP